MLIKYNSQASFTTTSGLTFHNGDTHEVSKEIGEVLISTFLGMFEDCSPKVEPKATTKITPKAE